MVSKTSTANSEDYKSWITNEFLRRYLDYVEETESPRLMHIWSVISCAAAAMGRHAWLETGIGETFANQYILLVGPPGTRKSTAINTAKKLLQKATNTKFAPKDTGGKRQGLISAIADIDVEATEEMDTLDIADAMDVVLHLENSSMIVPNQADRHCIYICASEFGSFIGQNNLELTRFLLEMWDGEDYPYRLKNQSLTINEPLVSMVAGTTPSDIATLLPPEAIGGGFTARCIFIYAGEKYKQVPPSKAGLKKEFEDQLKETFAWIENTMRGAIKMTEEASDYSDALYCQQVQINDPRFIYYSERRHTHLMKLALSMAALRQSMAVDKIDLEQAHLLLQHTEETMPEALGEYGMSPLAVAKQRIVDFIKHAKEPVTETILWAVMQRDMKMVDFKNCILDLQNAKKIIEVKTDYGPAFVYNDAAFEAIEALLGKEAFAQHVHDDDDDIVVDIM